MKKKVEAKVEKSKDVEKKKSNVLFIIVIAFLVMVVFGAGVYFGGTPLKDFVGKAYVDVMGDTREITFEPGETQAGFKYTIDGETRYYLLTVSDVAGVKDFDIFQVPETGPDCTDTDGGLDEYIKGTVLLTDAQGVTEALFDYCKEAGDGLLEYSCRQDLTLKVETFDCTCQNGACEMPISCNNVEDCYASDIVGKCIDGVCVEDCNDDTCRHFYQYKDAIPGESYDYMSYVCLNDECVLP